MLIVSGKLFIVDGARDEYLASCHEVVAQARGTEGCLDFALSADPLDPDRINIYERWESDDSLQAFRGSGPDAGQMSMIRDAEVQRYRISAVEPA